MNKKEFIKNHLLESAKTKERIIENCLDDIVKSVDVISHSFSKRGKLLICGNGGSAADAQHIAAEFIVRLSKDIVRPGLPAIALTTDTSLLTAAGNDIGFDNLFKRQVEALGQSGDVFLGITTSGNSENVLRAAKLALEKDMKTIGFIGNKSGKSKGLFDIEIKIPAESTQHIQEGHITVGHIICELVERSLF